MDSKPFSEQETNLIKYRVFKDFTFLKFIFANLLISIFNIERMSFKIIHIERKIIINVKRIFSHTSNL